MKKVGLRLKLQTILSLLNIERLFVKPYLNCGEVIYYQRLNESFFK